MPPGRKCRANPAGLAPKSGHYGALRLARGLHKSRGRSGMSGSISSASTGIATYLSAIKDEQAQVTKYVESSTTIQRTVANFESEASSLSNASAILKNYGALQVLTGAYNMSGQIDQTAILNAVMTQDPSASDSLVQESASTNYLHLAKATMDRSSQTASLGDAASLSLTTSGAAASTLTMENTAWSATDQTSTSPGTQWSFVLNDGTAQSSITAALDSAAEAAGFTSASYSISSTGTVTASGGGPAVTSSTDSAGNTTYTMALDTDSTGAITKQVQVVSVAVTAGTSATARTSQLDALTGAMTAAGFDASLSSDGTLSVIDPPTSGTNTLAPAFGKTIGVVTSSILRDDGSLALGATGKTLSVGDIITDGTNEIGTVASVDAEGNVTLNQTGDNTLSVGDDIEVATGLAFSNVGSTLSAQTAAAAGATTLALGKAGTALTPGQLLTAGGVTIGTVGSVDSSGTVTLLAGTTAAISAGESIVALPSVTSGTTAALSDAANVSAIASSYETSEYEDAMNDQSPGLGDALYYTRTMSGITSITQLMSDKTLLNVVTTALGMDSWFGALDYDQQVRILTSKVDLKDFTSSDGIKQTAEQYMIAESAKAAADAKPTGLVAMLMGESDSTSDLLSMIAGIDPSTTSSTSTDPTLSLFA